MNWRIKGVLQKTLTVLPGGVALNDLLQRTVGGLRNFDQNVATKVNGDWVVLAGHLRELGRRPQGLRLMEIGTGWYPTLPVCWHLAGAAEIITFDLQRHLSPRLTRRMLAAIEPHLPAIATAAGRAEADVRAAYSALRADQLPIDYRAPADATTSRLPDNSVDIVFSNSVLEHVPAPVIAALLRARDQQRGGVASHERMQDGNIPPRGKFRVCSQSVSHGIPGVTTRRRSPLLSSRRRP